VSSITRPVIAGIEAFRRTFTGEVHVPGDAGYDAARAAWNLAADQHPAVVASPRSVQDVVSVMALARESGLRVAPQSTGHNASARSPLDESILVRMDNMRAVEIDAERRIARAEGGALCMDVGVPASELGLAGLLGSSPDVGIVGYTLGGGIGWLARAHGMCCNNVAAVELVLADGTHVRCDHEHRPELFWAVRGGTGSFGVITAIELELFALALVYGGAMLWPWERAGEVLHAWREWTLTAPEAATTSARIVQVPPVPEIPEIVRGRQFVIIDGAVLGTEAQAAEILAPLRALGPEIDTFAMAPPAALSHIHMDPEFPVPGISTHAMLGDLPAEAIDAMVAVAGPGTGSALLLAEIRHLGGALGRVPDGAGARGCLEAPYIMFALGSPMVPEMVSPITASLQAMETAMRPWATNGAYLNFAEEATDTSRAYGAETFRALQAIKAEVDPTDVIHANHPIAPAA
jgi:hypothetical protein